MQPNPIVQSARPVVSRFDQIIQEAEAVAASPYVTHKEDQQSRIIGVLAAMLDQERQNRQYVMQENDRVYAQYGRDMRLTIVSAAAVPQLELTVPPEQYPMFLAQVLDWMFQDSDKVVEILEEMFDDPELLAQIRGEL